ncbi:MAG: M20/M25/M40 family metallo-hydrolase [Candidatus Pacebacteria bacterium]|nr:M20/M25/M40 family metallo-hydrolase [Candidatus Paceibacterota bacterium]
MLDTVDLLAELMRFQPVTDNLEQVNALADFARKYLTQAGVHTSVEELAGRRVLYAATVADKECDILLNAHLDVVPADNTMFTLTQADGWLRGRGTHDCLGNCALIMQTLIKLKNADVSVGAIFSTDEETGGATTKAMVDRGYRARRLVLVCDGSGYSLVTAQKGVVSLTLRAHGTGCHAAEPWKGDNAIDRLIEGYRKIQPLFPPINPPDEWHNTAAATTIRAGNAHNRVPDSAEMTLNVRFTETTDFEELLRSIRETSGLEADPGMLAPPVFCNPENSEIQRVVECMRTMLGRDIAVKRSNGATDARHFVDMGVPIAIIGIPGRDLHGDNEALELKGLKAYEELLPTLLQITLNSEVA